VQEIAGLCCSKNNFFAACAKQYRAQDSKSALALLYLSITNDRNKFVAAKWNFFK